MRCAALLLIASIVVGGCTGDNACEHTDRTAYSCEPLPAGSAGCIGGPTWRPEYALEGPLCHADVDKVFPVGCRATIAESSRFGSNRTFECMVDADIGEWKELL